MKFETPPRERGDSKWVKEAIELRERPGEWAVLHTSKSAQLSAAAARTIRVAKVKAWQPAGSFEAIARTVDGEHRVYARYVGNGDAA